MATSVYVSDLKLIKCQLNLEIKKYYNQWTVLAILKSQNFLK